MTIAAPTGILITAAIEAECRRVMARRASLKLLPGTHGEQAEMVGDCDVLLDRYLDLTHGQGPAPHA